MSKFRNIPEPPYQANQEDLNWFQHVKYNLEILMGQRQDDAAILRSDIKVQQVLDPKLVRLKTGQQGVEILSASTVPNTGNVKVPTLEDYLQLQQDVDALRADVEKFRSFFNTLTLNLRASEE
jgi:hypothetical protein